MRSTRYFTNPIRHIRVETQYISLILPIKRQMKKSEQELLNLSGSINLLSKRLNAIELKISELEKDLYSLPYGLKK